MINQIKNKIINRNRIWDQIRNEVIIQVNDPIWNYIWPQVEEQVRSQEDQVRFQVDNQVWRYIWDQVKND